VRISLVIAISVLLLIAVVALARLMAGLLRGVTEPELAVSIPGGFGVMGSIALAIACLAGLILGYLIWESQSHKLENELEDVTARVAEEAQRAVGEALRAEAAVATSESGADRSLIKEVAMTQQDTPEFLENLRTVIDAAHRATTELGDLLGVAETRIRECEQLQVRLAEREREYQELRDAYDALVREHQSTVATLAQIQAAHGVLLEEREATLQALNEQRTQYQALVQKERGAAEELETILRRLRG